MLVVANSDLTNIGLIDGGADFDTLKITGMGTGTLALSSFDAKVTSIEKLDILDGVNSTLALSGADIRAMVDNGNASSLIIRMDSGDILSFTGGDTVLNNLGGSTFNLAATHYVFTDAAFATATLDFVTV